MKSMLNFKNMSGFIFTLKNKFSFIQGETNQKYLILMQIQITFVTVYTFPFGSTAGCLYT